MKSKIAIGLVNSEYPLTSNTGEVKILSSMPSISSDRIIITSDIRSATQSLRYEQGFISARWLSVSGATSNIPLRNHRNIAFIELSLGSEPEFVKEMEQRHIALLKTKGIFDCIALAEQSSQNLESILATSRHIRNFQTSSLECDIEIASETAPVDFSGKNYIGHNKYERRYSNNPKLNWGYFDKCEQIAQSILSNCGSGRTIIFAPLRGAKPIVEIVMEFLSPNLRPQVVYPVPSSFVFYPESCGFHSKTGKSPAGGRYANILELRRLLPHLKGFDNLVYIDEIVSGGMMVGHCREMVGEEKTHKYDDRHFGQMDEGILRALVKSGLRIHVFGLADADGRKFRRENLCQMETWQERGLLKFQYFPVRRLVTEDQRYVLGLHYSDYELGPQAVPMISDGEYHSEKLQFQKDFLRRKS